MYINKTNYNHIPFTKTTYFYPHEGHLHDWTRLDVFSNMVVLSVRGQLLTRQRSKVGRYSVSSLTGGVEFGPSGQQLCTGFQLLQLILLVFGSFCLIQFFFPILQIVHFYATAFSCKIT